jgi:outer membrane protein OmpA-like peptidoglycan-associated protein
VRRHLISRGVAEDKIRAQGFGMESPVAPNNTTEGRANDRRVEIVLSPLPQEPR